jgi:HEPN domain-containing protein
MPRARRSSVEALCRWAAEYDPEFEALRPEVAPLDGHYLPARYPNSVPDSIPARIYNREIAVEALQMADRVLELVRRKLREDL